MTQDASSRATSAAAAAAATHAIVLPSTFRAAVTHIEEQPVEYRRAGYQITSRRIRLGVAKAHGTKKAQIGPRPAPPSVDPWQVNPRTLADETRTIAVCPTCEATKKEMCRSCTGVGTLGCGECAGSGRVMGQRGLKNCPVCRGNGVRRCAGCNGRGQVECATCEGLGRVQAWLEVEESRRTQILVHPRTGVVALHPEVDTPENMDRDPRGLPFPLASDTGWGLAMPAGLAPELIIGIDPFTDRIAARRLQVFVPTVFRCHYQLVTGAGVVEVAGDPPRVLADDRQWRPWRRRWLTALGGGGLMLVLALLYFGHYVGRATWFGEHPSATTVLVLALAAGILSTATVAGLCLPRRARGWLRFRLPGIGLAGAWGWMLLLWLTVAPSADGVREAVQRGDLEAARHEAVAVEIVQGSSDDLRGAVAEIEAARAVAELERRQALDADHLERVKIASSARFAAQQVALEWEFDEPRRLAIEGLLVRASAEMAGLFEQHDAEGLVALADAIEPYDDALAARARSRGAIARAVVWRRGKDLPAAVRALDGLVSSADDRVVAEALDQLRSGLEGDIEQRLRDGAVDQGATIQEQQRKTAALLVHAELFTELTGRPPPLDAGALRHRLEVVEAKVKREQEQEAKREARADRREAARRAKAEARAARLADRVECCDGTSSPSCRYSQGSLRGCCSHHGGVC